MPVNQYIYFFFTFVELTSFLLSDIDFFTLCSVNNMFYMSVNELFFSTGFFGGKYLKNRQNKVTEVEMRNLSVKKSSSLPDLQAASQSTQKKESWFSLR